MEGIYGKAKVCVGKGNCLPLEPGKKNLIYFSSLAAYTKL